MHLGNIDLQLNALVNGDYNPGRFIYIYIIYWPIQVLRPHFGNRTQLPFIDWQENGSDRERGAVTGIAGFFQMCSEMTPRLPRTSELDYVCRHNHQCVFIISYIYLVWVITY